MKEWFNWIQQYQGGGTAPDSFIWGNISQHITEIQKWIKTADLTTTRKPGFDRKKGVEFLWNTYKDTGLVRATVEKWFADPAYNKLFEESGTIDIVDVPDEIKIQIRSQLQDIFHIDWDTAQIEIYSQNPGDIYPLHYDRITNDLYGASTANSVGRWLIMLDDQQPGQCFFINNQSISWQAGDVLEWKLYKFSHGGANFGYDPRYVIKLTGKFI
jgi:hypothetical protein